MGQPFPVTPGIERISGRTGDGSAGYVTAFSSFEPYELTTYLEEMATALPGVKVVIERMPTGLLAAEFSRRRPAERPCMILGWADTAAAATRFSEFIVTADGSIASDPDGLIRPTGFSIAFICDRPGLAARGLAPPTTWHELEEPRLRQRLLFPDPRLSGAGFLALSTVLQAFGNDEGWRLMEAIDRNVLSYPASSWDSAKAVGEGLVLVGVTVRIAAARRNASCAMTDLTVPREAEGLESEVYGITRFARDRAATSAVLAWFADPARAPMFERFSKVTCMNDGAGTLYPVDAAVAAVGRAAAFIRFSEITARRAGNNENRINSNDHV